MLPVRSPKKDFDLAIDKLIMWALAGGISRPALCSSSVRSGAAPPSAKVANLGDNSKLGGS